MLQNSVESGLPANRYIKEKSIPYREFDIAKGHVMLTEAGNELLHNRDVWTQIHRYIEEIKNPKELADNPTRIYFREGGNAHIFLLGNLPLAIKEMSNSLAMRDTLTRLEELYRASTKFPDHIRVPLHYGMLSSRLSAKEYLLMQKVGDGLNVADVIDQPQNFGQAGTMAVGEYSKAKEIVENILRSQGLDPEVLLGDWKEENVLVDFSTPSSSFPFTLWIIDQ